MKRLYRLLSSTDRFAGLPRPLVIQYVCAMGVLLGIGIFLLIGLQQQKRTLLSESRQTQTILARTIEAELVNAIRTADQSLFELALLHADKQLVAQSHKADFWQRYWRSLPESSLLFATDATGKIIVSSQSGLLGRSVAEEGLFPKPSLFPGSTRLFLSQPNRLFGEERVVTLSRIVTGLDGTLAGIVSIALPTQTLEENLSKFRLKPSQTIALMHDTGIIIARQPGLTATDPDNVGIEGSILSRHLKTGLQTSTHTFTSIVDGQQKIGTALTVNTHPIQTDASLVISVSDTSSSILAPWHRMQLLLGLYLAIAMLAIWFGIVSFQRHRDNESARALIEALLATPGLLVLGLRENREIALFNGAATELTGYDRDFALGKDWIELIVPEKHRKATRKDFASLFKWSAFHSRSEIPILAKDNKTRIVAWRNVLIHSYQGKMIICLGTDITEHHQQEEDLRIQAQIDTLTGIPNRRHFLEMAGKALSQARRHHHALSLLMLDIDHFKQVNDTYGHPMGDRVLQAFSNQCGTMLRGEDLIGRLGGEEFAVLLPHTDIPAALVTAERIREGISALIVTTDDNSEIRFTVSIGLAAMAADDKDCDPLIQRADIALYHAKHQGRNQVAVAPGHDD
jgi:diguanylate cyclase (GGDEF)-like protein/PAS domain S-box-containing protein